MATMFIIQIYLYYRRDEENTERFSDLVVIKATTGKKIVVQMGY